MDRPIYVTEPHLPDFDRYVELLRGIWERKQLTNQGPLVRELESSLQSFLRLENEPLAVCNGALGLQIALKTLPKKGEIITTPFSYVATTSCPLWEGFEVRFADIEEEYLTLDPVKVEELINENTVAILATHVFGNPCDVEAFDRLSQKYDIPVIYDAAHAFGVTYKGRSILEWGDASMVSFHATKLFHTVEGGLLYSPDISRLAKMEWMRRFGHDGPEAFHGVGINAKMSEVHAAMGLCNLNYVDDNVTSRRLICNEYDEILMPKKGCEANNIATITYRSGASRNFIYYPIFFETEGQLLRAIADLNSIGIQPRRYFYPDLSKLGFGRCSGSVPISVNRAKTIMCLPLASNYTKSTVRKVAEQIYKSQNETT